LIVDFRFAVAAGRGSNQNRRSKIGDQKSAIENPMKVSAKAEYACIAMLELAANHTGGQPIRIKAIADAHDIPERFLVQILLQLKTRGLVASVRGASGGYQLARSPENISLADILNAMEVRGAGPPALAKVRPSPAARTLLTVWSELQAEEQRLLENISLAELLRRSRENTVDPSYQI
jgi:Rrf2 family protein